MFREKACFLLRVVVLFFVVRRLDVLPLPLDLREEVPPRVVLRRASVFLFVVWPVVFLRVIAQMFLKCIWAL